MNVTGWPQGTIVRGRSVMWEGEIIGQPHGQPIRFIEALPMKGAPHDDISAPS